MNVSPYKPPAGGDLALAYGGGRERVLDLGIVSTRLTVPVHRGNVFKATLGANTTVELNGALDGYACAVTLFLYQDATGSRTVTWPSTSGYSKVLWASGSAPTIGTTASTLASVVSLLTIDGGKNWVGGQFGASFS